MKKPASHLLKLTPLFAAFFLSACDNDSPATSATDTQQVSSLSPRLESTFKKACANCHNPGVMNAPKTGSSEVWEKVLDKGMPAVITNVKSGIRAMPPMGQCFDCSDEDFAALINYMAKGQ